MNVKLLRDVQALILQEPRKLDMNAMLERAEYWIDNRDLRPPCGTVGCIAGWAHILSSVDKEQAMKLGYSLTGVWDRSRIKLGLDEKQACKLFAEPSLAGPDSPYVNTLLNKGIDVADGEIITWPVDLAKRYEAAETPAERAQVVSDRIDRFIATNGAE